MRTITVDIINDQAERALEDLEKRHLIRMRRKSPVLLHKVEWSKKYKGAMTKEPPESIEIQFNELRGEWD